MTHFVKEIAVRHFRHRPVKAAPVVSWIMLLSFFVHSAVGHCSITVMPMEVQLKTPVGGARINDDMEVYNSGEAPIHVTASVMDWDITEKGNLQVHEPGTRPRSCATWIQLNPMSFAVPPKKSVRVRYSITLPHEITEEHWAMVFFQTRAIPMKSGGVGINVSTRIGSKIFIVPNRLESPQGKITDIAVSPLSPMEVQSAAATLARKKAGPIRSDAEASTPVTAADSGQVRADRQDIPTTKIKVVFQNTGPANVRVTGTIEVRDMNGSVAARGVLSARTQVLSGATRELWAYLDKPLAAGTYQFRAVIDYGAKELVSGALKAQVDEPATLDIDQTTQLVSSVEAK